MNVNHEADKSSRTTGYLVTQLQNDLIVPILSDPIVQIVIFRRYLLRSPSFKKNDIVQVNDHFC